LKKELFSQSSSKKEDKFQTENDISFNKTSNTKPTNEISKNENKNVKINSGNNTPEKKKEPPSVIYTQETKNDSPTLKKDKSIPVLKSIVNDSNEDKDYDNESFLP